MRDNQMHFLHDTLNIHKRVFIVAMGMVRQRRQYENSCTSDNETEIYFELHAYLL
jgi:hypothetical protein